jgi:hypothetical protein
LGALNNPVKNCRLMLRAVLIFAGFLMSNNDINMKLEKHLAQIIKQPRRPVDDVLCVLLAEFGTIFEQNKLGHTVRPDFLRWALKDRVHAVVGWSLCRATPESAAALRAVMLVACSLEPRGYSFVSGYGTLTHRKFYGWISESLFGPKNEGHDDFITPAEAAFIAGVAANNFGLLWQYREKPRYRGQGGAYALFVAKKLSQLAAKYERIPRARGICVRGGDSLDLAKPNPFARQYLGALWNQLTEDEKFQVEDMSEFAFVAAGDVYDWPLFYAERLTRLLKRKFKP